MKYLQHIIHKQSVIRKHLQKFINLSTILSYYENCQ
jgi:hypothetical protein